MMNYPTANAARKGTAQTIITCPNALAWGTSFYVFGHNRHLAFCSEMLSWFRPDCTYLGHGTDAALAMQADAVVIMDPDWNVVLEFLPSVLRDRTFIFPIPIGDPHQFYSLFWFRKRAEEELPGQFEKDDIEWFKYCMVHVIKTAVRTESGGLFFFNSPCLAQRGIDFEVSAFGTTFRDGVSMVEASLADIYSREVYRSLFVSDQESLLLSYFRSAGNQIQYFDVARILPGDVVINIGVLDGWEIAFFSALMEGRGKVISFDPCGAPRVTDYAQASMRAFPDLHEVEQAAIANFTGQARFPVTFDHQAVGSMINAPPGGMHQIDAPVWRLDDYVAAKGLNTVSFIKMDIEGGEVAALLGMAETIRRFRPVVAASIYHSTTDFVEVPLVLLALCSGYRFYVRTYGWYCNETVFYAVPEERPVL
jgi:FkbM family methyltransferase